MERVAFSIGALCGRHNKSLIKSGIMRHNNRTLAVRLFLRTSHHFKHLTDGNIFTHGATQWVININAVKLNRFLVDIGAFKRLNMKMAFLIG